MGGDSSEGMVGFKQIRDAFRNGSQGSSRKNEVFRLWVLEVLTLRN